MVRHMVAWNYADGFTDQENCSNAETMKNELEALKNKIEGIVSIQVYTNPISSSESDIFLDSVFESEEALKSYIVHPEHVRAGGFVKKVVKNRKCLDFNM